MFIRKKLRLFKTVKKKIVYCISRIELFIGIKIKTPMRIAKILLSINIIGVLTVKLLLDDYGLFRRQ